MQQEEGGGNPLHLLDTEPVDIEYLREALGSNFIHWLLGSVEAELRPEQNQVAGALHQALKQGGPSFGRSPGDHVMSFYSRRLPEYGTIALNVLRNHATGESVALPEPSGNQLFDVLRTMASEVFGLLLLRSFHGDGSFTLFSFEESGLSQKLFEALGRERRLSRFAKDRRSEEARSIDTGGFLLRGFSNSFAYGVITASWALCKFDNEAPRIADLWDCIECMLEKARRLLADQVVPVDFAASLTGVTVSAEARNDGASVCIRPTRVTDRPYFIEQMMSRSTNTTTVDSRSIKISDAGDVILRSTIPLKLTWEDGDDGSYRITQQFPEIGLDEYLENVRLALILAIERDLPPVTVVVWNTCLFPLAPPMYPYQDPQLFATRMPIELTELEVECWLGWIARINAAKLGKLRVAITRLLRASTERRDPYDALVDSVIVWESVFGARGGDVTLRVTSCVAKLLWPNGKERRRAQAMLAELYDTRSNVVHGGNVDRETAEKASQEALRIAVLLMRALIEKRQDLLNLDSPKRSVHVLLDDGHGKES